VSAAGRAFAATLERLGALRLEHLAIDARIGAPDGEGWLRRADLLAPGGLDRAMAGVGRRAETTLPAVQGTWLLEGYVFALALPALAALLTERRVPDVGADNVALGCGAEGVLGCVTFAAPRFSALAADLEAREAGAGSRPTRRRSPPGSARTSPTIWSRWWPPSAR